MGGGTSSSGNSGSWEAGSDTFHLLHVTKNFNASAGGSSTNGANRKIGRPGGVALCDKTNQTVGVRGAFFGYFLGKQKVTRSQRQKVKAFIFQINLSLSLNYITEKQFNINYYSTMYCIVKGKGHIFASYNTKAW